MQKVFFTGILFLILICNTLSIFAQFEVKGTLINQNNEPIEFAEIILFTVDSVAIKSSLSDSQGFFKILTNKGNYNYEIRQVGKVLKSDSIELQSNFDLGAIMLNVSRPLQNCPIN